MTAGIIPILISGKPNNVFSFEIMKSQAQIIPIPPPKQAPCTSAIVGIEQSSIVLYSNCSCDGSHSFKSAPEQKTEPSPRMTIALNSS